MYEQNKYSNNSFVLRKLAAVKLLKLACKLAKISNNDVILTA